MDELLALILGEIAEFLLEALLELIAAAILALVSRALLGLFKGVAEAVHHNRVFMLIIYALLGALAGTLSLLVIPHPLLQHEHPWRFHGISVLISPIVAGLVLSAFGGVLRRQGKKVTPIETFNYGFAFALGMAVVRLFFAK